MNESVKTTEEIKTQEQPTVVKIPETFSTKEVIEGLETNISNKESNIVENNIKALDKIKNYSGVTESDVELAQIATGEASKEIAEAKQKANEKIAEVKGENPEQKNPENKGKEILERKEVDYDKKIDLLSESPNIDTAEVFCSVDMKGLPKNERRIIQDNPENWEENRRLFHEEQKKEKIQLGLDLNKRLEKENPKIPPPTIFALRGCPGAGKTTSLRKGHEMFKGILDENGQPSGSLAPDVFKGPLKEKGNLSSNQVHAESTMLGRAVKKELSNANTSVVFDKLMNEPEDIEEMIESAKETNRKIAIMDIDVPLELSAIRVLGREKGGADPNINFNGVADGFKGIRKNREVQHKALDDNPQLVNGYVLMAYDKESRQSVEVAVWDEEAGKVRIIEGKENLVDQSIKEPEEEIERVKNTIVTEEFINNFLTTYFDEKSKQHAEKTIETLRQYLGKTIGMALDEKAL